uniref:Uncharacterized protein n=1 Tax=Syphacia muris TaxID=451379 RepID=A0A0N5AUS6_9BILA
MVRVTTLIFEVSVLIIVWRGKGAVEDSNVGETKESMREKADPFWMYGQGRRQSPPSPQLYYSLYLILVSFLPKSPAATAAAAATAMD